MSQNKRLNIAIVSPFEYTTPPPKNVIRAAQCINYHLANGLVQRGHSVSLIAPKGSKSKGIVEHFNLNPLEKKKVHTTLLSKNNFYYKRLAVQIYNAEAHAHLYKQADRFDIIHTILYPEILPFAAHAKTPTLCTLHQPPNEIDSFFLEMHKKNKKIFINALSKKQASLLPKQNNHIETVYNGIDINDYDFGAGGNKLIFVGRMLEQKGPHIAIKVAQKTNKPLNLYGENPYDQKDFWNNKIKPNLNKKIQYRGLLEPNKIAKEYRSARILLFPIQWEEAFGLVMVEAMACGTPVIAFKHGSVPEIIKDGKTGFIVKNEKQMINAVKKIYSMPEKEYAAMRRTCRTHVEKNFSMERMVNNYEKLYYKIVGK